MSYGNRTPNYGKMTVAQLKEIYATELNIQLQEKIKQIPRIVDEAVTSVVREVVGNTLGIERDTWGKWSVKYHRRDHNLSFVHKIEESAERYVEDNAEKLTKTYLTKLTKEDTEQLKEDYRSELFSAINNLMSQTAAAEAKEIFAKLEGKKKKVSSDEEVSDD